LARTLDIGRQAAVFFHADWCKWCRMMDDSTFTDPEVIAMGERVVYTRINVESDTATANKYRVRAFPTVILMTPEGNEVDRIIGFLPPDQFQKALDRYLDGHDTFWDIERKLNKDKQDPELLFAMAEKYAARGQTDESQPRYEQIIELDRNNAQGWTDDALFALGRQYRDEERWYKAIEKFRRLVESFPKSDLRSDAEAYIPWLYEQAGDTVQALKHYRALTETLRDPDDKQWSEERIRVLDQTPVDE
jgi:tetratricopeptide (TPR) repeat protein